MTKGKKSDPAILLQQAVSTDCDNAEIQLCLASLSNDDVSTFQNVIISKSVADVFRHIASVALRKLSDRMEESDIELHEYIAGPKLDDHQVEHLDLTKHDSIASQIEALDEQGNLEDFDADDDFIKSLRFYVIIVKPKKGNAIKFFRSYSPKRELSRSPLFAITLQKAQYDKVVDLQFMFDRHVDCFAMGNDMFILNKGRFEQIFQFYEILVKSADAVLATIKKHIPIDNFDDFKTVCKGHIQKLAKLKNISDKPYLKELTLHKLKLAIKEFNLSIETVGTGKKEKLHFDPAEPWAILKLLDDDYLGSTMTDSKYEVNSKRTI